MDIFNDDTKLPSQENELMLESEAEEIQEVSHVFSVPHRFASDEIRTIQIGNGRCSLIRTITLQGRFVKVVFPRNMIIDIAIEVILKIKVIIKID